MADMGGTTWSVVSQREDFRDDGTGQYAEGYKVTFRTGRGQLGSVFVSRRDYTPEVVRQRIAAEAVRMDAVADLVG